MEHNIEMFEKISKYAEKELDFNLRSHSTEFFIYDCALCNDNTLHNDKVKLSAIINLVYNAWLKTDNETDIGLGIITDYVVENYDTIINKSMGSSDILVAINDGDYDTNM